MSQKIEVSARILLRAAPERVWEVALDWARQGDWIPFTAVTPERGGADSSSGDPAGATVTEEAAGQGVGARVRARTALGPAGFTDTMMVTEWDPPRRCVVAHTGNVLRGEGIFEVLPRGQFTEFRWTELGELPVPPRLQPAAAVVGRWTVAPVTRLALAYSLRRLARLVQEPGLPG